MSDRDHDGPRLEPARPLPPGVAPRRGRPRESHDTRTALRMLIADELGLGLVDDMDAMSDAFARLSHVDLDAMTPIARAQRDVTLARIERMRAANRAHEAIEAELAAIAHLADLEAAEVLS